MFFFICNDTKMREATKNANQNSALEQFQARENNRKEKPKYLGDENRQ